MPDFGIFRGFNDKLFGNKLYAGQLPTQLGEIGSENFGYTGLLDAYPNAAAAYSLRLLRSGYFGYAIRVRRSSDNTEQDIGFTALGALDTTSLTSFCGSGNGFVTTWYDQSGNNRNFIQTTAASQPQIVSSGIILQLNNKPTITMSTIQNLTAQNIGGNIRVDHFVTMKQINLNGVLLTSTSDRYLLVSQSGNSSTTISQNAGTPVYYFNNIQFAGTTRNDIYNLIKNQVVINLENTNLSSWTANTNQVSLQYAGTEIQSNLQEYIMYNSNQSSNRTGINTNINTYYGIY